MQTAQIYTSISGNVHTTIAQGGTAPYINCMSASPYICIYPAAILHLQEQALLLTGLLLVYLQ